VFHTASPFFVPGDDMDRKTKDDKLIKPAVEGTKNVLQSVAKHKANIKCVSMTSSVVAMYGYTGQDKAERADGKFSELDWNVTSNYDTLAGAYMMSKTQAEKAAWETAKKEAFKLVTINPALVLGPAIMGRGDGVSVSIGLNILKEGVIGLFGGTIVDVRDVAKAHIASCVNEKSQGRYYIGTTYNVPVWEAYEAILPLGLPNLNKVDKPDDLELTHACNNDKVTQGLGIKITDMRTTFYDMVKSMQVTHKGQY